MGDQLNVEGRQHSLDPKAKRGNIHIWPTSWSQPRPFQEKKGKVLRHVLSFGSKSDATMMHWKKWRGVEQDFINYLGDIMGPSRGSREFHLLSSNGAGVYLQNTYITSIHGIVWICWTFLGRENTTRAVSCLWRHGLKHILVHSVIALRFVTVQEDRDAIRSSTKGNGIVLYVRCCNSRHVAVKVLPGCWTAPSILSDKRVYVRHCDSCLHSFISSGD